MMSDNDFNKLPEVLTLGEMMKQEYGVKFAPIISPELDELRHKMAMFASANSHELDELRHKMAMFASANSHELDELRHKMAMSVPAISPELDELRHKMAMFAPANIPGLDELRRANAVMNNALVEYRKQFYVPDSSEITSLAPNLEKVLSRLDLQGISTSYRDSVDRAMKSLSTPWLNIDDKIGSLTAVSKLHEMGHLLNNMTAFSDQTMDKLRENLGDWRGKFDLPKAIFTDPFARHDFYIERGFDPSLTDFPTEAFEQVITVTGIKSDYPPLVHDYDYEPEYEQENEEEGIIRITGAYNFLHRLESQIRKFIDERMKEEFGDNWAKHQASGMHHKWRDIQDEARNKGEKVYPLIAYADFTDYEQIITRNDNWEKVFKPIFRRKTFVQESFCWIYPIRNHIAHNRIITSDDKLYLNAAGKKILKAINFSIGQ